MQRALSDYRVEFFTELRVLCAQNQIELELIYGNQSPIESMKNDAADLSWAKRVENRYFNVFGKELVWQGLLTETWSADLVIVEQATRLLSNYFIAASTWFTPSRKFAIWGHGVNHDPIRASWLGERIKAVFTRRADWCFAYTADSKEKFRELGVPEERITNVQNSVSIRSFEPNVNPVVKPFALFIGSLYDRKRVGFLIEVGDMLAALMPDFRLFIAGDGPDRKLVEEASAERSWLYFGGALHGPDLARFGRDCTVFLNPGLIGLGVVHAFALGLPVITVELPFHSPEFSYLTHGINALVLGEKSSSSEYADAVYRLLLDHEKLLGMRSEALRSAEQFSLVNMVENFAKGIEVALSVTKSSRKHQ